MGLFCPSSVDNQKSLCDKVLAKQTESQMITKYPEQVVIPEGFTRWNGGEQPVPTESWVDYTLRMDPSTIRHDGAGCLEWVHHGDGDDIIAYRSVSD